MKVTLATCFSAYLLFAAAEAGTNSKPTPAKRPAGYELTNSFQMNKASVKTYTKKYQKKLKARSLITRSLGRRGLFKRGHQSQDESTPQSDNNINPQPSCNGTTPALTTIDLTPAEHTSGTCYPGHFQPPPQADCDVVIQAQLYNSTGSLVAYPGSVVFVTYGKCATVFQNPEETNYIFEYNWAELGQTTKHLAQDCLTSPVETVGGVYIYESYLNYTLPNVMISLQRYDDRDAECPFAEDAPLTSVNAGPPELPSVDGKAAGAQHPADKPVGGDPADQQPAGYQPLEDPAYQQSAGVNTAGDKSVEANPAYQQPGGQKTTADQPVGQYNQEQYYNDKSDSYDQNHGKNYH